MRSIVYEHYLVDCILTQQFAIAKIITLHGLAVGCVFYLDTTMAKISWILKDV